MTNNKTKQIKIFKIEYLHHKRANITTKPIKKPCTKAFNGDYLDTFYYQHTKNIYNIQKSIKELNHIYLGEENDQKRNQSFKRIYWNKIVFMKKIKKTLMNFLIFSFFDQKSKKKEIVDYFDLFFSISNQKMLNLLEMSIENIITTFFIKQKEKFKNNFNYSMDMSLREFYQKVFLKSQFFKDCLKQILVKRGTHFHDKMNKIATHFLAFFKNEIIL